MILFYRPQKHFIKTIMLLWFLFFSQMSFGQNMTQTIRGYVYDGYTHNPLQGASVSLVKTQLGTTTDLEGTYRLDEVPVGRYSLQISFVGYETLTIAEILLESGKELVLEIALKESSSSLTEVVVKSTTPNLRDKILPSAEVLSIEETLRLPATFYDPARLVLSYAGVATNNDQANHMIIRGNSPNNMSWRLEGVEIVNPNHTSNAGTSSDRPSRNGGGVNMLSAQLLGNSTFMRGAFSAQYGNALSGIMDMNFRKGNNEKHEFTGQIGVIGIDLAAEGPLFKKNGATYLINYRYSTLGLLGSAGVDLGDEAINYQDLAFTTFIPLEKGDIKLFGILGNSSNIFNSKVDSLVEIEKDFKDIDFKSEMGMLGGVYTRRFNRGFYWKNVLVYSIRKDDYLVNDRRLVNSSDKILIQDNDLSEKLSMKSTLEKNIGGNNFVVGLNSYRFNDSFSFSRKKRRSVMLRPFLLWQGKYSILDWELGSGYSLYDSGRNFEPRLRLNVFLSQNQLISFSYGQYSHEENAKIRQSSIPIVGNPGSILMQGNSDLGISRSKHFDFLYRYQIDDKTILKLESYYQRCYDIPISRDTLDSYSVLNLLSNWETRLLDNNGTGKNYGIELTVQKYFQKNTFWLANISLYESKYKGSDGIERDTRFNGNYIVNATYGKEFPYSKKGKDYILGVNLRMNLTGGLREMAIDEIASESAGKTIYEAAEAYTLKQKDIFKTDLRIYWKRNKKKFNSTLALDIQNVTNSKNESFKYYDTFLKEVEQQYQLGLIPILSYRIEF